MRPGANCPRGCVIHDHVTKREREKMRALIIFWIVFFSILD